MDNCVLRGFGNAFQTASFAVIVALAVVATSDADSTSKRDCTMLNKVKAAFPSPESVGFDTRSWIHRSNKCREH